MHHPAVGFALGSQAAAMILEVLICWDGSQHDPEGWIYKSHVGLTAETGLSPRQQRPAIKRLVDLGLVKKRLSGVPPTNGFLLQKVRIQEWWFNHCNRNNLSQSTNPKSDEQPAPDVPILLYTSTTHDATDIPTPVLKERNPSRNGEMESAGTFLMRRARDEALRKIREEQQQNSTNNPTLSVPSGDNPTISGTS